MNRRLITVLYEDQLAAQPNNYGPHMLMLSCVADRLGRDPWGLRQHVRAIPKKGDSKLRDALREEGALLARCGPLLVMFDADRVRACYGLPSQACKRSVLDKINEQATGKPILVLLERNMEDVVTACCQALLQPSPQHQPTPSERDAILHKTVAAGKDARDRVLQSVPSFERLVRAVHDRLNAEHILES
jgi:hypothetical protein